jgi:hypothetical protein
VSPWTDYGRELGPPDEVTSRRLERRMLARFAERERQGTSRRVPAVLLVAAAVAALVVLGIGLYSPRASERSVVTIATTTLGQELSLPRDGVLQVGPSSHVALQVSNETGAVVRLHAGEVALRVHAGQGVRWIVEVEAFSVEAIGTRFHVRRTDGVPEVRVEEGVVRLTGPGLPHEGLRIAAARETPAAAESSTAIGHAADVETPEVSPEITAVEPLDAPLLADGAQEPAVEPRRSVAWLAMFRSAIDAGEPGRAVASLPPTFPNGREPIAAVDFLDAGDALANQRETARAERAYRAACRRREAPACGVATFRLALIAARRSDTEAAIELATRYLEEHPKGALVREVMGRRMQWRLDLRETAGAGQDAHRYLARWPHGPHAELARRISANQPDAP